MRWITDGSLSGRNRGGVMPRLYRYGTKKHIKLMRKWVDKNLFELERIWGLLGRDKDEAYKLAMTGMVDPLYGRPSPLAWFKKDR
jgi:hypothetical protein